MPESVQKLVAAKASVSVESGAGLGAARTDEDFTKPAQASSRIEMLCSLKPTCWSSSAGLPKKISNE